LRVDRSLAARILREKGCMLEPIRQRLATLPRAAIVEIKSRTTVDAIAEVNKFLARFRLNKPGELTRLFARTAHIVDFKGTRWRGRDEIEKGSQRLFAPYVTKEVTSVVEWVEFGPGATVVACVLWENVIAGAEPSKSTHRMTIVLAREGEVWVALFIQVTAVIVD
jgi:uncharacterized protein (TIGR02246 family)